MKRFLLCLAFTALAACATTTPPTFDSVVLGLVNLDDAAIKTIGAEVQAGTITSAQATAANNIAVEIKGAIVLAVQANAAANASGAQAMLVQIASTLASLGKCLAAGGTATAITACIAAVPTP